MEQKNVNEEVLKDEVSEENEIKEEVIDEVDEDLLEEEDSEVEILNDKISELEEKHKRLLAEYQNYKRRSAEEALKSRNLGKIDVIKEIIDTADNLERALAHIDLENTEDELAKGVAMVYNNLLLKLEKLGVKEIETEGCLNADLHHAVGTDSVDDVENDHITEVFQKGYLLEDTVIRHAMVKVNQK